MEQQADSRAVSGPCRWSDFLTVERLVLHEGVYAIVEALEASEVFRPDGFEGLEIPLGRLWR